MNRNEDWKNTKLPTHTSPDEHDEEASRIETEIRHENQKLRAERNIMLDALKRIGESTVAWRDEEANSLIESIGTAANQAVSKIFEMEGMAQ
jgi:hypothetical protein